VACVKQRRLYLPYHGHSQQPAITDRDDQIGVLVMEGLKGLDDVAYVRFASVYRNFREAKDFSAVLSELGSLEAAEPDRK